MIGSVDFSVVVDIVVGLSVILLVVDVDVVDGDGVLV